MLDAAILPGKKRKQEMETKPCKLRAVDFLEWSPEEF
jgi:hypothetical protein